jgi:competence protein ComEA
MKDLWKILFSVLFTLLGVGLILLVSTPPRGQSIRLEPPPSPAPILVHVLGAVNKPGVYQLPAGSRVENAVLAAGGFLAHADQQAFNLAARVEDGTQINIPTLAPTSSLVQAAHSSPDSATPPPTPTETPTPKPLFPIDINTASQLELELLPQIGPVRAARIVAYRQSHGPFQSIEDIRKVYDISPEVYEAIRDLIIASEPPAEAYPTPTPTSN